MKTVGTFFIGNFLYIDTERSDCMESDYYFLKRKNNHKKYIWYKENEYGKGSIKERVIT